MAWLERHVYQMAWQCGHLTASDKERAQYRPSAGHGGPKREPCFYTSNTYSYNDLQLYLQYDATFDSLAFLNPTPTVYYVDAGQDVICWMSRFNNSSGGCYSWINVTGHLVTMPPGAAIAPGAMSRSASPQPSMLKLLSHGRLKD